MPIEPPPMQTVDLGGPIVYRTWAGPPDTTFVLVHGLGGSHLNWLQVAPGLSGLGRVLALDLPGFGRSPVAGGRTRVMDLRRSLARFIDDAATGRVVVVGNSMGGLIATVHTAVEPDRVAGLVLSASVFPWTRGRLPHPAVLAAFSLYGFDGVGEAVVRARRRSMSPEAFVALGLRLLTTDPGSIPEEVIRLQVELVRDTRDDPEQPKNFIEAARSIATYVRTPSLGIRTMQGIRCPVLVIHGRRDRFVPSSFAEAVLATYPSWRGRILPGVGHVPQMEAPGRWLAEVADWYAATLR
ncbi:MAG: alpha/beta fold hydrolase [Actinobacteria bacterium]|nr:MAG: alpha/beta fold hydrolase [Actinomycetota bacterium]